MTQSDLVFPSKAINVTLLVLEKVVPRDAQGTVLRQLRTISNSFSGFLSVSSQPAVP